MNKTFTKILSVLAILVLATNVGVAYAAFPPANTTQGGTGTTSPSGLLYGDNGSTQSLKTAALSGCTFSAGTLTCSGSPIWPFTTGLTNFGVAVQATTTPEWFQNGMYASSTSYFVFASSTALSATNLFGGTLVLTNALTVANGGTGSTTLSTNLLRGNGTDVMNAFAGTACTNQFIRSLNGAGVATCETVDISGDTNLTAGRSLTLSSDEVSADTELYTFGFTGSLLATSSSEIATTSKFFIEVKIPVASTITAFSCHGRPGTTGTSTVGALYSVDGFTQSAEILYSTGVKCGSGHTVSTSTFGQTALAAGSSVWFYVLNGDPEGTGAAAMYPSFTATKDD